MKVIVAEQKFDCTHLLGQFAEPDMYDTLLESDCDVYMPGATPGDESKIIAKFRKNYFSKEQQDQAYNGLRAAATPSQNRGLAAGPRDGTLGKREWVTPLQEDLLNYFLNPTTTLTGDDPIAEIIRKHKNTDQNENRGSVWRSEQVKQAGFVFNDWAVKTSKLPHDQMPAEAKQVIGMTSDTTYANQVNSGIAGWFDRYPRIPYLRECAYTKNHFEDFQKSFPFLQSLNKGFAELLPARYAAQRKFADKIDSRYFVPETVFTTVTVNSKFRTAMHYDAGDYTEGLSNLLVLSNNGNYSGGYLVAPEYRVAFNVRPGDLLLINNHEVMHGNTEMVYHEPDAERVSLVCYLREGMANGGTKEYEETRYEFVESRRLNADHPLQRMRWNGISPDMFADKPLEEYAPAKEWYEFLKGKPEGDNWLDAYHPHLKEAFEGVKLDEFFG